MPQRIGILRVTFDGTTVRAEVGGQLTPQEWVFAIEMTKARVLQQAAKASPVDLITRKVDKMTGDE